MADKNMWFTVVLVLGAVFILVNYMGKSGVDVNVNQPNGVDAQCQVAPTYTYSAIDKFLATSVGGTSQIKQDGLAPVTSLAAPTVGSELEFWKDNSTHYCDVAKAGAAKCGTNTVQTVCYKNATTVTMELIDTKATPDVSLTDSTTAGANNVTIGANDIGYLDFTFQGTSKESLLALGGCVAVEYPNTFTSMTLSGALSSAAPCPYKWTYSAGSTSNVFQLFAVPAGFDAEQIATKKTASMILQSGSSNPSGYVSVTLRSANYYVGNDGKFHLGIEKDANQDTTVVGSKAVRSAVIV
jgi:hypothetical protein